MNCADELNYGCMDTRPCPDPGKMQATDPEPQRLVFSVQCLEFTPGDVK